VQRKPKIFLSYATEDVETIKRLRRRLATASFDPFMASRDIQIGSRWMKLIAEKIRESE
jgi:TIR domain